jgi:hypothetical protein
MVGIWVRTARDATRPFVDGSFCPTAIFGQRMQWEEVRNSNIILTKHLLNGKPCRHVKAHLRLLGDAVANSTLKVLRVF